MPTPIYPCRHYADELSKLRHEELSMLVILFMHDRLVPAACRLLLVGVIEELRSVEVLLLGTEEVVELGLVLSREVYFD